MLGNKAQHRIRSKNQQHQPRISFTSDFTIAHRFIGSSIQVVCASLHQTGFLS